MTEPTPFPVIMAGGSDTRLWPASRQLHHRRAEHWVVVRGTARVSNGEHSYLVTENESTFIPIGQEHCLENPGSIPLELVVVRSGSYLDEDDIERLDDIYDRQEA